MRERIKKRFAEGNELSGVILIACTTISLFLANLFIGQEYLDLWEIKIVNHSLTAIVNDMLMTFFFLVVGLEIKKEILVGELNDLKKAYLSMFCAIGGMVFPALIFFYFNNNSINQRGWAIPTATDIAFSLGVLALLGNRIPVGLRVFLTALAIIDDLGAVIVIALFYSKNITFQYIILAVLTTFILFKIAKNQKFNSKIVTVFGGCLIWFLLVKSGIHGTIAGVLLAISIPLENYQKIRLIPNIIDKQKAIKSTSLGFYSNVLHKPVTYFLIPLFATVNTAVIFNGDFNSIINSNLALGIIFGLVFGKPIGILFTAFIFIKLKVAKMPQGVNFAMFVGVAILAGIGFTMSMFVSFIAFDIIVQQDISKIAILIGSVLSGVFGLIWLSILFYNKHTPKTHN